MNNNAVTALNRKTDITLFQDFIFDTLKYKTYRQRRDGSDTIIEKTFTKHGKNYILIARFVASGDYIGGFLTNEYGCNGINGRGFSVKSFINLCCDELEIKEIY